MKIKLYILLIAFLAASAHSPACDHHHNVVRHCGESHCEPDDDDDDCTKKSKLNVALTSGNINLGSFVRGCTYEFEQPENELEFEITGNKAKNFWISINTSGSDVGTLSDVLLDTEWRYSTDSGCFNNCLECLGIFYFKKKMIVSCFVNEVRVSNTAQPGERNFTQVLTVSFMF